MTRRLLWPALVLVGSFGGGLVGHAWLEPRAVAVAQSGSSLPPPPAATDRPTLGPDRFGEVIRQVAPAVVSIDAVKSAPATAVAGKNRSNEESGSGVIVRLQGRGFYAITNNHVVGGARKEQITVTLADGRILVPDGVWADPASDVAVLRLSGDNLPSADLGDSDRVQIGQWVLAFGSPYGLNQTVTHGIISARDRGQIMLGDTIRIKEFLQTDAAINPGSSGGPLADMTGAVIGINTAIASNTGGNTGVSFSIPANLVKRIARELLEKGYVSRGYLGLQLAPTLEPAAALRLGLNRAWGALVETVYAGGPAAAGGVMAGDVILKLDAVEIRDENHLINLIGALPGGQRVRLTVWRNRQARVAEVVVRDWYEAVGRGR
ncbi:MAG: trypsin-like peptidase domain-containing protein [Gemmataceae bacterium]